MDRGGRLRTLATVHGRKALVTGAAALLVVLIAVTLARLLWLVIEGPQPSGVARPVVVPKAANAEPVYTPEMAAGWRLFGDAPVGEPDAGDAGDDEAPATRLSLQLLGVFSTGDTRLAGAVIAERGQDGELYRIGASLPGGASLDKVEAGRVLLRRRGQIEALTFDTLAAGGGSATGGSAVMPPPGGGDLAAGFRSLRERMLAPPDDDGSSEAEENTSRARNALANLANDLRSNPDGVMSELGLRSAGGGGYLVGEGPGAELLRNMGLRAGDVVLSVNGKAVGNVHNDVRLVDEVKASGEARVEIRRGSQTFTVNYPL